MDIQHIEELAKQGESRIAELKTSTGQLKSAMSTLCAFLNGQGGTVLIGVKDNGEIIGQDITDNTKREIAQELKKLEPTAHVEVHYIPSKKNKYVITLHVNSGNHAPYTYDGRPYQRDESETNKMSQHRYEQLLVERGQLNHSWEETIATEYAIDDLDQEEIYKTIADGIRENRIPASAQKEDIKAILERLELTTENKLKRAAIVLYAKPESMKLLQPMIKMARFKGTDKLGDFIDNQQLYGNAFRLLSEADAFLRRHLPIASFFKSTQFKRIDKPILPVMAIREALINTICHRDYADRSTDISLAIFDDRLELWNSGSLLKKLTIEDLRHVHESVLRNRLIANVFYVRGLIEKWGIGTNKMIDLCRQEGIPEPEFVTRSGGLAVIFKFKESVGTASHQVGNHPVLSSRQEEILSIIKAQQPINIQKLVTLLKNPPSERMVRKDLKYLKEQGVIDVKGSARNSVWILK